jgi:competence protein ComEA
MGWKDLTKDYLTFSRKERIGFIAIAFLVIIIWFSPKILIRFKSKKPVTDTSWITQALKLKHMKQDSSSNAPGENLDEFVYERSATNSQQKQAAELFYFDPNTATTEDWKRLGLRAKTIRTIANFRNKGGHFYKPSDLQKVYGLREEEFDRLLPFVKIEKQAFQNPFAEKKNDEASRPVRKGSINFKPVDINEADSNAFIALPGIGPKLSARIVNFREKLGGFYSIDQVGETYGLADTTFSRLRQYFVITRTDVKKLDINTATKDQLKSHPYFKWPLANAIVEYRSQHGKFSSIEDLKKISLITDDVFSKIKFYLSLQ